MPPATTTDYSKAMIWIAPSEKDIAGAALKKNLRAAAEQFRVNSGLKAQEYSGGRPPGLYGIIFMRFAENRFAAQRAKLAKASGSSRRCSRIDEPADLHA